MKNKIYVLFICTLLLIGCSNEVKPKKQAPKKEAKVEYKEYQYFYGQLDKKEKVIYDKLYKGIIKSKSGFFVEKATEEKIQKIVPYILADHPEIFWCTGEVTCWSASGDDNTMEVYPIYNRFKHDKKNTIKSIEQTRDEIIASITVEGEFEKVKAVYDYVTQNYEYIAESIDNQNVVSALLNKQTVCAGYAKAVQYILNGMDVDTTYLTGTVMQEGVIGYHAWNMVKVDGDYFYLDATWGDVVGELPHTCYNSFMLSDAEMLEIYTPDNKYEPTKNPNNSWAMRNGITLSQWDPQQLANLWGNALNNGSNFIDFKCSATIYEEYKNHVNQAQEMIDIMSSVGLYVEQYSVLSGDVKRDIHIFY